MRSVYSPRCECGLIILLSSSNKAVGEINGRGKTEQRGRVCVSMCVCCVGELCCSDSRAECNLSLRKGKERGGGEGRAEEEEEVEITWGDERPRWPYVVKASQCVSKCMMTVFR